MCTGFVKKTEDDIIYGYNLDIDPEVWNYGLYKTRNCFSVCITVGSTRYLTHGVNRFGSFACLPYMNGPGTVKPFSGKKERIDLLADRFIRNKYTCENVCAILDERRIVNAKNADLHALIADRNGNILLIEPGLGFKRIEDNSAVIANFPLLAIPEDDSPFYGTDRYSAVAEALSQSVCFGVKDTVELLKAVSQNGKWGTRLSFVYSLKENTVYYVQNNEFGKLEKHCFAES